ncbi:peptidase T [Bombilactobacillus thymidiniphilus]|uniref:Peptidase T n=1 Tax=Bombilactobacillus thymidiniphilus TaxID=2923363 RepID=A0ABY4PD97_9LACO|nr:peptidase T [Bombilactobacillus thymidiniphilus]UQS83550.1 peptidase T [Bombilactobacillus thymidiniphilus]
MQYATLVPRFLKYVRQNTRSDEESDAIPTTERQIAFLRNLETELRELGLSDVHYNQHNSYLTATLPTNMQQDVPVVGFLAHVDTADFNSENINPQIVENYDGQSNIALDADKKYVLDPSVFPNLCNYQGHTLITTDGTTLLGGDDKAGVSEIITAMQYLLEHPEIKHGTIRIGFSPDEETGKGARNFDVPAFAADFAYTVDGGAQGQLEYETFNAAAAKITITGKNVHPSTAKDIMINANLVAVELQNKLPSEQVPEKTTGRDGFFLLTDFNGTIDKAQLAYIIRDFERSGLESRKQLLQTIVDQLNAKYGAQTVQLEMYDQYYNMFEVIKDHMEVVKLARKAMQNLGITIDETPIRGGTDGSTISFMGLPTPNLFAGPENMHGRFEYVSVQVMEKAVDVILEIVKLNSQGA